MRYHLKNRATHWEGNILQLEWCVTDSRGRELCKWTDHRHAVAFLNTLRGE